jgi:hypothetical protein
LKRLFFSAPALVSALSTTMLFFTPPAHAQRIVAESSSLDSSSPDALAEPAFSYAGGQPAPAVIHRSSAPFSRLAVGAIISPLGVGAEAAVKVHDHFDVRVMGNIFSYSTNFSTNGFNVDANLHLASAGASLDYYPFHNGFRLSPGILAYNQNHLNAIAPVTPGTNFTLNDQGFYAATPNPALGITALTGSGGLGLHSTRPAFTATTGWGSLIPRSGRHWAIPFEIGAAFTGTPAINLSLTGWACSDAAQKNCTDVTNPNNQLAVDVQSNLQTQLAKWRSDLDPLKVYPIISTGIVFNFNIR